MKRFRLLLLDANVVIALCKLGMWDLVVEKCEVLLARTVFESEAIFFEDEDGEKVYLNLEEDFKQGRLQVVDVPLAQVTAFLALFKPLYLGDLDPGEKESLTYLVNSFDRFSVAASPEKSLAVPGREPLRLGKKAGSRVLRRLPTTVDEERPDGEFPWSGPEVRTE